MRVAFSPGRLRALAAGVAVVALAAAGCGASKSLKTYPVKGKVAFERGGTIKQLAGSVVEFESVAEPGVHAYGEIQEDGSFSMATQKEGVGKVGAVAGEHRVRIVLNQEVNDDGPVARRSVLAPRFLDFARSGIKCTVPTDQELVIPVRR